MVTGFYLSNPTSYTFSQKRKDTRLGVFLFWRKVWDSNPRARKGKRFSRPPRYDHFDNLPFMLNLKMRSTIIIKLFGSASLCPVAVPEKIFASVGARFYSTAATPFCSLHLPQAALANVPTSITFRMHQSMRQLL